MVVNEPKTPSSGWSALEVEREEGEGSRDEEKEIAARKINQTGAPLADSLRLLNYTH